MNTNVTPNTANVYGAHAANFAHSHIAHAPLATIALAIASPISGLSSGPVWVTTPSNPETTPATSPAITRKALMRVSLLDDDGGERIAPS